MSTRRDVLLRALSLGEVPDEDTSQSHYSVNRISQERVDEVLKVVQKRQAIDEAYRILDTALKVYASTPLDATSRSSFYRLIVKAHDILEKEAAL